MAGSVANLGNFERLREQRALRGVRTRAESGPHAGSQNGFRARPRTQPPSRAPCAL